jgi:hypothetical protein
MTQKNKPPESRLRIVKSAKSDRAAKKQGEDITLQIITHHLRAGAGKDREKPRIKDRTHINQLLEQLEALEKKTRPSGGDMTAHDKDQNATVALRLTGELVRAVAGWAIDHSIGVGIFGNVGYLSTDNPNTLALPDYVEVKSFFDNHDHEQFGGELKPDDIMKLPPEQLRFFVANALSLVCVEPCSLRLLVKAFGAANFNETETVPLLQITQRAKEAKDTYQKRQLQLKAICHVDGLCAEGRKKHAAQQVVADKYAVSNLTLRSWEHRLRQAFGNIYIHATLAKVRLSIKNNGFDWAALDNDAKKYKAARR